MEAADVVEIYSGLLDAGVQIWVDGGWGIDALVGEQTRPHKDFDLLVDVEDVPTLSSFFHSRGFTLRYAWPENSWVPHDERVPLFEKAAIATAFVIGDADGREIDVHAVRFDEDGGAGCAWDNPFVFPPDAFDGQGRIAGVDVRCLGGSTQMLTHTGYEPHDRTVHDLALLRDRLGIGCLLCSGVCPECGGYVGEAAGSLNWILCSLCHATFLHDGHRQIDAY